MMGAIEGLNEGMKTEEVCLFKSVFVERDTNIRRSVRTWEWRVVVVDDGRRVVRSRLRPIEQLLHEQLRLRINIKDYAKYSV